MDFNDGTPLYVHGVELADVLASVEASILARGHDLQDVIDLPEVVAA